MSSAFDDIAAFVSDMHATFGDQKTRWPIAKQRTLRKLQEQAGVELSNIVPPLMPVKFSDQGFFDAKVEETRRALLTMERESLLQLLHLPGANDATKYRIWTRLKAISALLTEGETHV
jgi:hypothetical protein